MSETAQVLTVQSVLYGNAPAAMRTAVESVCRAVDYARERGVVSQWQLAYGDCTASPVLDADAVQDLSTLVSAAGGDFRYEVFGENLGHGGGHNRLAPNALDGLLLILNPDGLLAPDSIERFVRRMDPDVGAVDGRQIPFEHPKDYDHDTYATAWASGACLMTTTAVFAAVGGFDHDTFFMYCDDVDYSWRVRLLGQRVLHAPDVRVFHDKRLRLDGGIIAGAAEVYYSAEAALMLPYKYSRNDVVRRVRKLLVNGGDEAGLRAVAEFDRRRREDGLPPRLDPRHKVGIFVHGNYAPHRYP